MLVGGPGGGYPQRKIIIAGPKKEEEPKEKQDSTETKGVYVDRGWPPPTSNRRAGRK